MTDDVIEGKEPWRKDYEIYTSNISKLTIMQGIAV